MNTSSRAEALANTLAEWFHQNKRVLPFRESGDPYKIWLSEILAQQTRITALLPYYERFIERFPTVLALAAAEEDEILRLWAGLGYYARAKNMHRAAKAMAGCHDGKVPCDWDSLRALPGVGDYTAGAVASIAFGLPYPAVDGNVRRVYARIEAACDEQADGWVREMMEHVPPPTVTEALMELGALICIPKSPRCENCPMATLCQAQLQNRTTEFPPKKSRPEKKRVPMDILLCRDRKGRVLLRRRPERLLHNMWVFPSREDLLREGFTLTGCSEPIGTAQHVFTHLIWEMTGFWAAVTIDTLPAHYQYIAADELDKPAIPSAMKDWLKTILNRT